MSILFIDYSRQDEIDTFYDACQRHREYYKGYPKAHHPLSYFRDPEYAYQCPPEMSHTYLGYPMYHVKYKQPVALPHTTARTSGFPALPERTMRGRYNKAACKYRARMNGEPRRTKSASTEAEMSMEEVFINTDA